MVERNYVMESKCTICQLPFDADKEGLDSELNGVPVKFCNVCYEAMEEVVEAQVPHTMIKCPKCDESIGIRVEVISDS